MKYFKKTELIKCFRENKQDRCAGCKLTKAVNRLPNGIEAALEALAVNVLDPAREILGRPIYVTSGFRCPFYNNAVGGVRKSQHILGEAADICVMNDNQNENEKLAQIIEANGKYDQLIRYMGADGKIRFIHVSWKRLGPNRKQIIYK